MAVATTTVKAKGKLGGAPPPAKQPELVLTPEMEVFVGFKMGRPRNLWRWLNRVYAWATGDVSRDEWDAAFDQALQSVDGKAMFPEDAATRVRRMLAAQLDLQDKGRVYATCAKCERSDHAIMMAFIGRPSAAFFHSRAFTLRDPGKNRG